MHTTNIKSTHLLLITLWSFILAFNASCTLPTFSQSTLLLPINGMSSAGKRINLAVEIPRGFRSLPQPAGATIQEFIPVTDKDAYAWSHIITTQVLVGRAMDAAYLIHSLKEHITHMADTKAKVLFEKIDTYSTYTRAQLIISYTNAAQNRREVMLACYYSGPKDCSGFQYAIAAPAHKSEADIMERLKDFADKKTSLVKY